MPHHPARTPAGGRSTDVAGSARRVSSQQPPCGARGFKQGNNRPPDPAAAPHLALVARQAAGAQRRGAAAHEARIVVALPRRCPACSSIGRHMLAFSTPPRAWLCMCLHPAPPPTATAPPSYAAQCWQARPPPGQFSSVSSQSSGRTGGSGGWRRASSAGRKGVVWIQKMAAGAGKGGGQAGTARWGEGPNSTARALAGPLALASSLLLCSQRPLAYILDA